MAGGAALERFRSGERVDFADELAYRATKRVVGISVRHGLAAAMHLGTDSRFHLCECSGFAPASRTRWSRPSPTRATAAAGRWRSPGIAAHYAENLTGMAWQHDRGVTSVVTGTSLSLGVQALFNVGRELTSIGAHPHEQLTHPRPTLSV